MIISSRNTPSFEELVENNAQMQAANSELHEAVKEASKRMISVLSGLGHTHAMLLATTEDDFADMKDDLIIRCEMMYQMLRTGRA